MCLHPDRFNASIWTGALLSGRVTVQHVALHVIKDVGVCVVFERVAGT